MSKTFVEKCEELAKASNGLDLETILSWRALPKFMEVLCKYFLKPYQCR